MQMEDLGPRESSRESPAHTHRETFSTIFFAADGHVRYGTHKGSLTWSVQELESPGPFKVANADRSIAEEAPQ